MKFFLFACASAASAAVAYGFFHQIGFSFATASMPEIILASGIGVALAGAVVLTARDAFFSNNDRDELNPLPPHQAQGHNQPLPPDLNVPVHGIEVAMPATEAEIVEARNLRNNALNNRNAGR